MRQFCQSTVEHFTQGQCYELALALHLLTGWKIAGVKWEGHTRSLGDPEDEDWGHVLCRTPEGYYIDITGIHTANTLRKKWRGSVKTARSQHVVVRNLGGSWGSCTPPGPKAFQYAKWLIDRHTQDPGVQDFTDREWW